MSNALAPHSRPWQQLLGDKAFILACSYLTMLVLLALLTPLIAPYGYDQQNLLLGASRPSAAHWLGTDIHGRDLLTRMLYGSRISLLVAFAATAVALGVGVSWGLIAGYLGGRIDTLMMRIVDILYALPFMILIILLTVVFGRSILLLFLAIGLLEWLTLARIVRAQVISIKHREFVEAAVVIGVGKTAILFRHILPNILAPIVVYTALTVPGVMLLEAFLSFIGLGVQPPQSSWGVLIAYGVESMEEYPWLLAPAVALSLTLLAMNTLGETLRRLFNPRSGQEIAFK